MTTDRKAKPYAVWISPQVQATGENDMLIAFTGTRGEIIRRAKALAPDRGCAYVYDSRDGFTPTLSGAPKARLIVHDDGAVYECRNAERFYREAP